MGAAPQTVQRAELSPEEARETGRRWFLDGDTGELKPDGLSDPGQDQGRDQGRDQDPDQEWDPEREREDRPAAVRVARWIFD